MGSDEQIQVGILGAANIAKKNVRGIKLSQANIEVTQVASRSLDKAQDFINEMELQNAIAVNDYEQLLKDDSIHAVYIPLPTALHLKWVERAINAGKHIILEKPITLDVASLKELSRLISNAANIVYLDGSMWPHNPRTHDMARAIADTVGHVQRVHSTFCFQAPDSFFKEDIRVNKELDGLGCIGDIGWYCVQGAAWAFRVDGQGLPKGVQVHPGSWSNEQGVVLQCTASVVWGPGKVLILDCGFDSPVRCSLQVIGQNGVLQVNDSYIPDHEHNQQYTVSTKHAWNGPIADTQYDVKHVTLDRPQESYMWEQFATNIRKIINDKLDNDERLKWFRESCIVQYIICKLQQSFDEGCVYVELDWSEIGVDTL